MGAETNALNRGSFPAPIFILDRRRLLVRLRAKSLGDEESFQQIEEALDDQGQR